MGGLGNTYWTAPAPGAPGESVSTLDVAHGVADFFAYGLAALAAWSVYQTISARVFGDAPKPAKRRRRR
ncbi:MAG: hypothetical protein CUN53_00135 [Phototrophicales bacterium]|nr:MAG: hypothetical protein CUN53_00135 [Phototrophicales bacterium]